MIPRLRPKSSHVRNALLIGYWPPEEDHDQHQGHPLLILCPFPQLVAEGLANWIVLVAIGRRRKELAHTRLMT